MYSGDRRVLDILKSYIMPYSCQSLDQLGMEKAFVCFTIPYLYRNRAKVELESG